MSNVRIVLTFYIEVSALLHGGYSTNRLRNRSIFPVKQAFCLAAHIYQLGSGTTEALHKLCIGPTKHLSPRPYEM